MLLNISPTENSFSNKHQSVLILIHVFDKSSRKRVVAQTLKENGRFSCKGENTCSLRDIFFWNSSLRSCFNSKLLKHIFLLARLCFFCQNILRTTITPLIDRPIGSITRVNEGGGYPYVSGFPFEGPFRNLAWTPGQWVN